MAISGLLRTYDQSDVIREDLEDTIASISPDETPLFALLNRMPVYQTKHEWSEDALRVLRSTLVADMTKSSANTSMYVSSGHGAARFPVSTTKPIEVRIDEEAMLAYARTTNCLTVTRDFNSSGTAAHSSGARIEIIADLTYEGADVRTAFAQTRTKPYNYTQIAEAGILVSGTEEQAIKAGMDSEADYQQQQRLKELKNQIERSILQGTRGVGAASTVRSMGGCFQFISSNKTNRSGVAITREFIEADAQKCYDAGGKPSLLVCGSFQARKITALYRDSIRSAPEDVLGGNVIQRILLPIAGSGELAVIPDRFCNPYEYLMLDGSRVWLGVYRAFFMEDLAKTGDATKSQVVGEYTLILKNEAAHARSYNLATS